MSVLDVRACGRRSVALVLEYLFEKNVGIFGCEDERRIGQIGRQDSGEKGLSRFEEE